MKRYRVFRDYQGGSFGMDRDYTAMEWLEQMLEWSEADDPSWCIEELAKELAHGTLKYDIYRAVERDYLRQDCDYIAEQNDIALTEEERELAVDEFMDCEAYVDAHAEDWIYWINRVKGE